MIISFGWTADYLPPKGSKDTTRRIWSDRTFGAWCRAWDNHKLIHDAVNKQLCFGGEYIGKIKLIEKPFKEPLSRMTHEEVVREGGMVASPEEFIGKYFDGDCDLEVAVIRFQFMPLELVATKPKQLTLL